MKIYNLIEIATGLPKSVLFNFSQLPFKQAVKMPVLVSWITKFKALKGKMLIKSDIHTGMIRIGLLGIGSGTAHYMPTVIENNGKIICNGRLSLGGEGRFLSDHQES